MRTREDFELDTTPARSIKDMVLEQICYQTVVDDNGQEHQYPQPKESLEELLSNI